VNNPVEKFEKFGTAAGAGFDARRLDCNNVLIHTPHGMMLIFSHFANSLTALLFNFLYMFVHFFATWPILATWRMSSIPPTTVAPTTTKLTTTAPVLYQVPTPSSTFDLN
jgi:hypothetical protein